MSPKQPAAVSEKKVTIGKFVPAESVLKYIFQVLENSFSGGIDFSIETLPRSMNSSLMPTVSITEGEQCLLVKPALDDAGEEVDAFVIFRVANVGTSTFLGEYKKNVDIETPGAEDIFDFYHLCDDGIFPRMKAYIEQWESPEPHM